MLEIDKHMNMIQMLELSRENIIKETEDSRKQIHQMKQKIKSFKDIMDKIIIKLGNVKQQVIDLRHDNEELVYQNEKLSLRAARGFDALTPRPDYRRLQDEKRFDLDIYDATGRRQIVPTIKIIDDLLNKLAASKENSTAMNTSMKKKGSVMSKAGVVNAFKNNSSTNNTPYQKRPSISMLQPKARATAPNNGSDSLQPSPMARSPNGNGSFQSIANSPRNGNNLLTPVESIGNEAKLSSPRVNQEDSNSNKNDESHMTDTEINIQVKSTLALKHQSSMRKGNDIPFGETVINEADELISSVVNIKKEIDNFEG